MPEYTSTDKLKEVERELYLRGKVYPRMIEKNQLTQKMAAKQIAIMEAIAADYREQAKADELPLETKGSHHV